MRKVLVIAVTVLLIIAGTPVSKTVFAEGISDIQKKINELNRQQNNIKKESGNITNEVKSTNGKIEANLAEQDEVTVQIAAIDKNLQETLEKLKAKEEEIAKTNQQINQTEADIKQLKADIVVLIDRIETREELLKNRLRTLQQTGGDVTYLEVIMGAQNFSDFLNRATAVNKIMGQDKKIMDTHLAEQQQLEDKQVDLEDKKKSLDEKKADQVTQKEELETLKAQLDKQMNEKEVLMEQLKEEQKELENYQISLQDEQRILRQQEEAVSRAIEEANRKKEQLQQLSKSNGDKPKESDGTFVWPTEGTITSGYGPRWGSFHPALDIANKTGTSVKAMADGIVISTNTPWDGQMNGYGNVILIAHSVNGTVYTTLYAHLDSMSVTAGQSVSKGQTIGKMGSTGNVTGPHLHFEVHKGGWNAAKSNAVNPMNMLP
ncbi:murein hydrolase activator EnvC family protein [Aquibacillus salsiterrae]|nr:M23 family metallopeptidase [Aquibacillus salsiterrae]